MYVGLPLYIFLYRKQLGHKNLAPIASKFLPPFPSSPAATHEGSVKVPRGSLAIGYRLGPCMADRRKRGAPVGLMSSLRPRQRLRPCTRQDMLKKMTAVAAVLMALSVVTATVVQGFGPKMRQSIHEPRRLVWGDTREGSRACAC